tara:strand:+ start:2319 stop:2555 length:237 start_codon:yes stop_codon:yes gene_type:complete
MVTKVLSEKIQLYILKMLSKQFMYADEIIENCIADIGHEINTNNSKLTIKNQLKELADNKMIAYYHGYKITPKGKSKI